MKLKCLCSVKALGAITLAHFRSAMRELGFVLTLQEAGALFKKYDTNKDGFVDMHEFYQGLLPKDYHASDGALLYGRTKYRSLSEEEELQNRRSSYVDRALSGPLELSLVTGKFKRSLAEILGSIHDGVSSRVKKGSFKKTRLLKNAIEGHSTPHRAGLINIDGEKTARVGNEKISTCQLSLFPPFH